jgi:hypothetical protein
MGVSVIWKHSLYVGKSLSQRTVPRKKVRNKSHTYPQRPASDVISCHVGQQNLPCPGFVAARNEKFGASSAGVPPSARASAGAHRFTARCPITSASTNPFSQRDKTGSRSVQKSHGAAHSGHDTPADTHMAEKT